MNNKVLNYILIFLLNFLCINACVGSQITDAITNSGNQAVGSVVDSGKQQAGAVVDSAKQAAGTAIDAGKQAADVIVDSAKQAADTAIDAGKQAADVIVDSSKQAAGAAIDAGKQAAGAVVDVGKQAAGAVVDAGNQAVSTVNNWMDMSLEAIASAFPKCLYPPRYTNFQQGFKSLDVESSGVWVSTGSNIQEGKAITLTWSPILTNSLPDKYLVLYRIDPRFSRPQVFIQKYDYTQKKYISDFHNYKQGTLSNYQLHPEIPLLQRITDYSSYFNFVDREKIHVKNGDVITISLIDNGFFNSSFSYELDGGNDPTLIYTKTPGDSNNKILYSNTNLWCDFAKTRNIDLYNKVCTGNKYTDQSPSLALVGNPSSTAFTFSSLSAPPNICPYGSDTKDLGSFCLYDKGRGMKITMNQQSIKNTAESFVHSDFTGIDFFYYKATTDGDLDFTTDWVIGPGMFGNLSQYMTTWSSLTNPITLYISNSDSSMNFFHSGRYLMSIEIGNGMQNVSAQDQSNIKLEYAVSNNTPTSGMSLPKDLKVNPTNSGNLWLRVINTNINLKGFVAVNYSYYTGSTWVSDVLYNKLISPLRSAFQDLTKTLYNKLINDVILARISKIAIMLYIMLYGLFFLIGAVQVTVSDLTARLIKIIIVVAAFSQNSWNFFNDNLFRAYVEGTDYLMLSAGGATSSATNIFGFIDPIFDKYTNPDIWKLWAIQLLQIHNGLTFFAIISIFSIFLFFRAVIEVVVGYCLAFLSLSVLISLAPFFIIFMLFERTKNLFDNWLSSLFNYMIQPTLLLIFFLLIEQMVSPQVLLSMSKACWGTLIPLEFGLDLRTFNIPINFSFELPFLPGIPFYVTEAESVGTLSSVFDNPQNAILTVMSSSLLLYSFCLMANGLVGYMSDVISSLTNVMPAVGGKSSRSSSPIKSVVGDMKSVGKKVKKVSRKVSKVVTTPAKYLKKKFIDQDYSPRREKKEKNYLDKVKDGSRFDKND